MAFPTLMIPTPPLLLCLAVGLFALLVRVVLSKYRKGISISDFKGPPTASRLLGHEYDLSREDDVGDLEFKWLREFGPTWKVRAAFGRDALMTADPKALQHIYHKSGYAYAKQPAQNHMGYLMAGPNIVWAQDGMHQRHRKIMNPAFSAAQLRSFLPMFQNTTQRLVDKWRSELSSKKSLDVMINNWISRVALDIIGQAAFDYDYKGLDENEESPLAKAYHGIFKDIGHMLPMTTMLFRASWDYFPESILNLFKYIPADPFTRVRNVNELYRQYGKQILREKRPEVDAEKRGYSKDIMSILVKANESSDPKTRLNDEEIMAQMYTLTLAGHETTATTISFLLYELARNPEYQRRMREEIFEARARVAERGGVNFSMDDLDGMTVCLNAIKETLRMHPIITYLPRVATKDDVLPLAYPVVTATHETISEVPIRKGQIIYTSFVAYNRLQQVWGDDAHVWNPDRFSRLDTGKQTYVGVFANLMTFSAGTRACIGWRFSIIEMQVLVSELVGTFQYSLQDGNPEKSEVQRAPSGVAMVPLLRGNHDIGTAMPLRVELVD
ncbi:PAH-inducible cytochrome P450 monooxygenase PC-PAH 4 [Cubamyces sp. BRFM 1775]|nr:PAH-inducible cytochrome P450 monooxygenase PC-PAH 4 [Cubamyces sp. BRFM 1775]